MNRCLTCAVALVAAGGIAVAPNALAITNTLLYYGTSPHPITPGTTSWQWFEDAHGVGEFQQGTSYKVPFADSLPPFEGKTPLGQSVNQGVASGLALQASQLSQGNRLVEMGDSQGTLVLDLVMLDDYRAGVPRRDVSFVLTEDEERGTGLAVFFGGIAQLLFGFSPVRTPVTPYKVTDVYVQYDPMSDLPNNPLSIGFGLAVLNAFMGQALHGTAIIHDLTEVPAADIHTTVNRLGGVTTTYIIPTPFLPLLNPLKGILPTGVLKGLNAFLQPIVNSAYSQKVVESGPTQRHSAFKGKSKKAASITAAHAVTLRHSTGRHGGHR